MGLKNYRGEVVNQKQGLEDICFDYFSNLYKCQQVSEKAMAKVLDGLAVPFKEEMNEELIKPFIEMEFFQAIEGMVGGKAP